MTDKPTCALCGEPMPDGETMFKYHGYSGPCPKPPRASIAPYMQGSVPEIGWQYEHVQRGGKFVVTALAMSGGDLPDGIYIVFENEHAQVFVSKLQSFLNYYLRRSRAA